MHMIYETAPAIISTFLYLHNVLMISRTSSLTFPYNTFFLYFGMNTIWYWHFHLVCDMLLLSIWTTSCDWVWLATPFSIYRRRFCIDILTVSNYSILPSIAGGLDFSFKLLGGEIYLVVFWYTFVHFILHSLLILQFCVPRLNFLEPKWSHHDYYLS